jgi:hypothetical protein
MRRLGRCLRRDFNRESLTGSGSTDLAGLIVGRVGGDSGCVDGIDSSEVKIEPDAGFRIESSWK